MSSFVQRLTLFLHRDLWKPITGKWRKVWMGALKRLYLTIRLFLREGLAYRASALTYSSLLSLVPILAIIFAVAKGFGLAAFTEEWIRSNVVAKPEIIDTLVGFVQSYLNHTQGGIFLGFGLLMLLYTLFSLTDSIESAFNEIWQVEQPRSLFRMVTDYTAVFFLLPIFIIVTSGLTYFIYSAADEWLPNVMLLRPTVLFLLKFLPYLVMVLFFTCLFAFMPNTHVKLRSALLAGTLTGVLFQLLQIGYLHSQVWLTSYNAIYGSFAALPLFLLMCQIAWMLTLFGGALAYVDQNLHSFYYGQESVRLSRVDHDCLCVQLAAAVCRQFAASRPPLSARQLATQEKVHLRVVTDILGELSQAGVLLKIPETENNRETTYLPAGDIHRLTPATLLETLDRRGTSLPLTEESPWRAFRSLRKSLFSGLYADMPLHELPKKE